MGAPASTTSSRALTLHGPLLTITPQSGLRSAQAVLQHLPHRDHHPVGLSGPIFLETTMSHLVNAFVKPHAFSVVIRDVPDTYQVTKLGPIELIPGDLVVNWIARTTTLGVHLAKRDHTELVGGARPGSRRKLPAFVSAAVLDVLEAMAADGCPVADALDLARQLETSLSSVKRSTGSKEHLPGDHAQSKSNGHRAPNRAGQFRSAREAT